MVANKSNSDRDVVAPPTNVERDPHKRATFGFVAVTVNP
jgi:hypothetical protein